MRGVLPLLLILLAAQLGGCLALRVPGLFDEAPPAAGGAGDGGGPNGTRPLQVRGVVWRVNDTWVWEASNGARITDRVVAVRTGQTVGTLTNVTLYDVQTRTEWARDLAPVFANHTYEAEGLGVVESRGPGDAVQYLRPGTTTPTRNLPLTFVGDTFFNVSATVTHWTDTEFYDRYAEVRGLGKRIVDVPAGNFQAWHVRTNFTVNRGPGTPDAHFTTERWFNETVRNDVRIVRSGVVYQLVASRVDGDARPINLPQLALAPAGWKVGWGWRYAADNLTITRQVIPCDNFGQGSIFAQCRVVAGVGSLVHERGVDYFALRTRTVYAAGGATLTETEVTLVPRHHLAPHATAYFGTSGGATWEHARKLNFSGAVPTYDPPGVPKQQTYKVVGNYQGPYDHDVIARIDPVGPVTTATPYGTFEGVRVVTNLTYVPDVDNPAGGSWTIETERVWAVRARNDVAFEVPIGGGMTTLALEGLRLGSAPKGERDL